MRRLLSVFLSLMFLTIVSSAFATDPVPVESIILDHEKAVVSVGKSLNVKATIMPKNATVKKLDWASSDESIATVINGKVKGITPGAAVITVAATDGSKNAASMNIDIVQPVTKITVEESKLLLAPGTIWEQIAYIEPADASIKTLDWQSNNPKVAYVDTNGVITAVAAGKCTIIGSAMDDSKKKVTVSVQVKEHDVMILKPGDVNVDFDMSETEGFVMGVTARGAYQDAYKNTVKVEKGLVKRIDDHTLKPVAAGSDIVSVVAVHNGRTTSNKKYTVFVSQAAVRQAGAIPENTESGEILYRDIPWRISYTEVKELLEKNNIGIKPLIVRNHELWGVIDGELAFGNFTAFRSGLTFSCESIDTTNIKNNNDNCSFYMADYYFSEDIPFENLKQNVMKAYGLSQNETTGSDSECSWTMEDVTVTLTLSQRYTKLAICCNR